MPGFQRSGRASCVARYSAFVPPFCLLDSSLRLLRRLSLDFVLPHRAQCPATAARLGEPAPASAPVAPSDVRALAATAETKCRDDAQVVPEVAPTAGKMKKRGPRQGRNMRVCVATRQRLHRDSMWRVVRTYRGLVALDHGLGRSAYISHSLEAVLEARKKNKIGRALRAKVPQAIYDELVRRAQRVALEDNHEGM